MVKTSTLFYIFDNIENENELYTGRDLTEEKQDEGEIDELLGMIEYTPSDDVLARIYKKAF
jgi:hypothetical protein